MRSTFVADVTAQNITSSDVALVANIIKKSLAVRCLRRKVVSVLFRKNTNIPDNKVAMITQDADERKGAKYFESNLGLYEFLFRQTNTMLRSIVVADAGDCHLRSSHSRYEALRRTQDMVYRMKRL